MWILQEKIYRKGKHESSYETKWAINDLLVIGKWFISGKNIRVHTGEKPYSY